MKPPRVCLFTDTLGDVNGVSRFIGNIAEQSLKQGRGLHVLTSTRFVCPDEPNIHNIKPRLSIPMPGYSTLDIVWPDSGALMRTADALHPDAVHVSTPGPVGAAGRRYALSRGLPLLGTYHTDFPAYIAHLFNDDAMTWVCAQVMRRFYAPFDRVFTRSADYAKAMGRLGIASDRIERLLPGIDTGVFHMEHGNPNGGVWKGVEGVRPGSVKVLYVGRVSVEKNLPMLGRVWTTLAADSRNRGLDVQLIVVGDGPHRAQMKRELAPHGAIFTGFRHGKELSAIYANSDVFVFPSTTDTLGQVVMEAQSAGLPVVVTDKGGPREVVDHGKTGLILRDEREWVPALLRLVEDRTFRRAMGDAAHAKIQPMSIAHSFAHFWSVHEGMIAAKRTKPERTLASAPARR